MPLHIGHLALIDFALQHCDQLYIVVCYTDKEPIEGEIRKQWLYQSFKKNSNITLISYHYDDKTLPNTSVSSRYISRLWAKAFKELLPDINVLFTSEEYGNYLEEYMRIQHLSFDKNRSILPVSATDIRSNPFLYWNYISDHAKPWFVKKIAIVGSESTGKSVLTERLAKHFNSVFVPEMAREIIEKTNECRPGDLYKIAQLHAKTIQSKQTVANKLLFVDTDLITTKSYSQFLFNQELLVDDFVERTNKFDLYLFMEPDCGYVQDGTRLSLKERNALSTHHKKNFENAGVSMAFINGSWDERFRQAIKVVDQFFNKKAATNK